MAERRNGGTAELVKIDSGGTAEGWNGGGAEWQYGYIPTLPDRFTVHRRHRRRHLLIIYSIDPSFSDLSWSGSHSRTTVMMALSGFFIRTTINNLSKQNTFRSDQCGMSDCLEGMNPQECGNANRKEH